MLRAVHDPRADAAGQAVRGAGGSRVHRRLPAPAQHRRRALVRAGDPAARARRAARRQDLHRRQQRAGEHRATRPAPDFVVTGYVPDVTPYFTGCRVSIAPLRYGAGVKGKINLAMSYGLPVVATTPSVEGMSLAPERDVLVADDARRLRRRDRPRLPRRGAVAAARGRRPREHPHLLLARRRAQRDHPAHRVRARQREPASRRSIARPSGYASAARLAT